MSEIDARHTSNVTDSARKFTSLIRLDESARINDCNGREAVKLRALPSPVLPTPSSG